MKVQEIPRLYVHRVYKLHAILLHNREQNPKNSPLCSFHKRNISLASQFTQSQKCNINNCRIVIKRSAKSVSVTARRRVPCCDVLRCRFPTIAIYLLPLPFWEANLNNYFELMLFYVTQMP